MLRLHSAPEIAESCPSGIQASHFQMGHWGSNRQALALIMRPMQTELQVFDPDQAGGLQVLQEDERAAAPQEEPGIGEGMKKA